MIRAAILLSMLPVMASAQAATNGNSAELRMLDKQNGVVTDLTMANGETRRIAALSITLHECRFPRANPAGDAYAQLTVNYSSQDLPVFEGWMIASAPALNAMDHPRYDVWVLKCNNS